MRTRKKSTPGKWPYIRHFQRPGIYATKYEKTLSVPLPQHQWYVFPHSRKKKIPSNMCSPTWKTHIPSDMWFSGGVICFPPPGKHIPSGMCSPTRETHTPSDMCSPTWESHIPRNMIFRWGDMCSPTWETHIPSGMCSPTWETHIPSDMCSPIWETDIPSNMCSPTWETHIPSYMCSPTWEAHIPSDVFRHVPCYPICQIFSDEFFWIRILKDCVLV